MGQIVTVGSVGGNSVFGFSADSGTTLTASGSLPTIGTSGNYKGVVWSPARAVYGTSSSLLITSYSINEQYVAASFDSTGTSGFSTTSTDGINWTTASGSLQKSASNTIICYGQLNNSSVYSAYAWAALGFTGGVYVAVATYTNKFSVSYDGVTWQSGTLPSSHGWRSIAYGSGKFVIVDWDTVNTLYSTDLVTWTAGTLPAALKWGQRIVHNGAYFCVISDNTNASAVSTDGINWTAGTMPSTQVWQGLAWNGSVWCAVARMTTAAATSPDGINWTARTIPAMTNGIADLIWDGTNFVGCPFIAGTGAGAGIQSPDGVTWATIPSIQVGEGRLAAKPSSLPVTGSSSTSLQSLTGSAVAYYGISSQMSLTPVTGTAQATVPVQGASAVSWIPSTASGTAVTAAIVGGTVTAQKMTVSSVALSMPIMTFEIPIITANALTGIISDNLSITLPRPVVTLSGTIRAASLVTGMFSVSAVTATVSQSLGIVTTNYISPQSVKVTGIGFVGIIGVSP